MPVQCRAARERPYASSIGDESIVGGRCAKAPWTIRSSLLKKHVVILGAGFAGLELASRLSDSLADEVDVTLIDQNDSFTFGFSKLDILFGRKDAASVRIEYSGIAKNGVEFRQECVTSIDPTVRRVTTDKSSYDADIL